MRDNSIVIYNDNPNNLFRTTQDLLTKAKMTIVLARSKLTTDDYNGFILIDDGKSYMNMKPEGLGKGENFKVLQLAFSSNRLDIFYGFGNPTYKPPAPMTYHYLDKLIILDSADLETMDYACYIGSDNKPVDLQWTYVKDQKTTIIFQKDKSPNLSVTMIQTIRFGKKADGGYCTQA